MEPNRAFHGASGASGASGATGATGATGAQETETLASRRGVDVRSLALTVLAVLATLLALRLAAPFLVPLTLAILIRYALEPIVGFLVAHHVGRGIASTGLALGFLCVSVAAAYGVADHGEEMLDNLPVVAQKLRNAVRASQIQDGTPLDKLRQAATELRNAASDAATTPPSKGVVRVQVENPPAAQLDYAWWGGIAVNLVVETATIIFLVFLFLISGDQYKRKVVKFAGPALSRKKITLHILEDINTQIARYLLVTLFVGVLGGLTTALIGWVLGLSHLLLWGVAATVLSTVPFFGPLVIALALGLAVFVQFDSTAMALSVALVSLTLSILKGSALAPWLSSKTTRMNNIAVVTGLLFWAWIWGIPGVLLAVPIMTTFKAICDRVEGLQPIGAFLAD